ncbi:MAG TPA: hypothetical protein VF598_06555 [Hymenobacter sp.]
MRPFSVSLLLLATSGLSECTSPTDQAPPAAAVPAAVRLGSSSGFATGGGLGPNPAQRRVPLEDVVSEDSVYAATLPVLNEADGAIRLRVALNPRAHSLQQFSALFAPHSPSVTYRQIGQGIGKYDAKTGHYYFNVGYQKVSQRPDGGTYSGNLQEINGWIDPGMNAAAVAHRADL